VIDNSYFQNPHMSHYVDLSKVVAQITAGVWPLCIPRSKDRDRNENLNQTLLAQSSAANSS